MPLLLTSLVAQAQPWAIAIHGGAGESEWKHMDTATASAYHASLARALAAGSAVLARHGSALDAVEASVEVLEDDPLFNAGRGSAFAADGTNEMDAALMNGATLEAGSVASIHFTRHPIALARAVMEHTPYVMMVGSGADAFSRAQGLQQEPPAFFFTEMRWQEFADVMRTSGRAVPPHPAGTPPPQGSGHAALSGLDPHIFSHRFGTVGAVARDVQGHLAAATSTGGMQGKLPGRVGDSPIIGAGTYASDRSCAVSGTGVGEYFIRLTLARQVGTLVEQGKTLQQAADQMIHTELPALKGGEGGVIVLGRTGEPVWSNNTVGIFHAQQVEGSAATVWVK
ncbi:MULTISPECIES: isoaspartyl peptidase/L-asparaginase family protein [Acidobacteriaceae]|uniref:isoaspartyl peptidase/L-asparaginase family protein n=1 Tax=Acidobacteriaceae TaxID=204434 RepID=UPI0020B11711|nr:MULTISPECIES: isoaspartyl peptidase/L-asparaginase [Acidobacteriaceae]MDW5264981.1 isoaspartyl peptidase/L-asparaginase [Edaphobacter sp.]